MAAQAFEPLVSHLDLRVLHRPVLNYSAVVAVGLAVAPAVGLVAEPVAGLVAVPVAAPAVAVSYYRIYPLDHRPLRIHASDKESDNRQRRLALAEDPH